MKKLCVLLFIISVAISCYAIDTKTVFSFSKNTIIPPTPPAPWGMYLRGNWVDSGSGRAEKWTDSSGNNRHLIQSTGSLQPLITSEGLFNDSITGNPRYMTSSGSFSISANSGFTYIARLGSSTAYWYSMPILGSDNSWWLYFTSYLAGDSNTGNITYTRSGVDKSHTTPNWGVIHNSMFTLAHVSYDDGSTAQYLNGGTKRSYTGSGIGAFNSTIQVFGRSSNPFDGTISSFALYSRALSDSELILALGQLQ